MLETERYRLLDLIGTGGLGEVYRVEDLATATTVAMKIMPRVSGVANLRSEFVALARLHHDNIVTVFDYGLTSAGKDYFTMELVSGPPLLEAIAHVPSPQFYQVIGGVLRALAFLHARTMVHADIKPSNILIDGALLDQDPLRATRLVDFGLAAALADPEASSARGTFPYAAPEVYSGRLDARSDLYALGVVLYELVTGVQPYVGANVAAVIAAQRRAAPRNPSELRPELPADLSELIVALLDPLPGARPQTADEVLERINTIAGTSFATVDSRPLVDLTGIFVGRDRDLDELHRMWAEAGQTRGSVALISGEEGIGKSRLLAELVLAVQLEGGRVYSADVAADSEVPYAGLRQLVRTLVAGSSETLNPTLTATLAPLLAGTPAPVSEKLSRYALAEAITEVIFAIAAHQPLLIAIDDVHLADPATTELLAYLARSVAESSLLLAIAGRDEIIGSDTARAPTSFAHLVRAVDNAVRGQRFQLPPFDRHSLFHLAEQGFGREVARSLHEELFRASSGNPAHAARALELLVQQGTIARERGAWVVGDDIIAIPLPAGARASALARAAKLTSAQQRILATAALLGDAFTRDLLAALLSVTREAELDEADDLVDATLADCVGARLLIADAASRHFRFAHGGVAEALYAGVSADDRTQLHQHAAALLEERAAQGESVAPAALARHYLVVGDARGVEHGVRAARQRAESYDHHGALDWYERVRPLIDSPDLAADVDEQLGDLFSLVGEVDDAIAAYQRAADAAAERPADHIRLARRLGELMRRRGEGEVALTLLMSALDEARRHRLVDHEGRCQLRIGWVLMYRADYKAAMEHAVAGHLIATASGDRATAAELGRLRAAIDTYRGDPGTALEQLHSALADAESTGDDTLLAGLLHAIGRAAIHAGDYARAIDALEQAITTAERVGQVEQVARSLNNLGAACYFQGDWPRARSSWERFRRLCERLDEHSELVNALNNLGSIYRGLGQFAPALAALDRATEVAAATGHTHMAAMIRANRGEVLFRQGDQPAARECYLAALEEFERIEAREDIIETWRRLAELDLAAGKLNEALERTVDAARQARDAGIRLEEGMLHRVAATALRLQGDLESASWFAEQAGTILTKLGAAYELAKLDAELAELRAAQGRTEEARERIDAAIAGFAALGARWHLTRARARARLLPNPASPPRSSTPRMGLELLLELTQAAGSLEIERLLEIALDKLLALTHFERGFILLLDAEGRPSERTRRFRPGSRGFARDEAEFSGTIVRRVAANGEPVAVSDIAEEDELREQKSVVALGLRQIMCAPMRARGRVIGIVYIDSRRLAFEEHGVDLALLEAFAAQLSLAIENARMLADEKRQSELLAVLAHEIRNPLAGILGYAEIGEDEANSAGSDAAELFANIGRDADRLRRLVDNVLELARHETGNVEWSMMPFAVEELIADVVRLYTPQCALKKITIAAAADTPRTLALGNPDRIMQVLSNLVGNAVKFTPSGGHITVAARHESVAGTDPQAPPLPASELGAWSPTELDDDSVQEFVRVDVVDTGPGMSEEVRARLFEKFAQGAGKQRTMGVGLGLYISRGIILRHGGTIFVDSTLGQGSTFSFRLPVA